MLADKGYPDLEDKAKEQIALNHFLGQIEHTQVAFSVKQKRPKTLDEAVSATLEMESYLCSIDVPVDEERPIQATVGAVDSVTDMMKQVLSRIDKLEERLNTSHPPSVVDD